MKKVLIIYLILCIFRVCLMNISAPLSSTLDFHMLHAVYGAVKLLSGYLEFIQCNLVPGILVAPILFAILLLIIQSKLIYTVNLLALNSRIF
jgi:hypothetical protein